MFIFLCGGGAANPSVCCPDLWPAQLLVFRIFLCQSTWLTWEAARRFRAFWSAGCNQDKGQLCQEPHSCCCCMWWGFLLLFLVNIWCADYSLVETTISVKKKKSLDLSISDLNISNTSDTCKAASWRHRYLHADTATRQAQIALWSVGGESK